MPDQGNSLTPTELASLGVATDLRTAGRAFGIGKSTAYKLAKAGAFPCDVKRVGSRWVVPTAELRRALGVAS
ncbi:excise [Gordonia phage Ayotoya]|uniref:Helix-turn-helix DNA binding domain protein n=6 Tax=Betterkatzvirus betterkatz TaxID=2560485 RepID=A0A2Z5HDL3_9CAUD|nr:excise [Gordonia phage Nadeem]AZS11210.1 excise [Gordonia phage WheatThin]QAU06840.1 excise [Gordonia phage Brylie]QAX92538.1 excise [Gordonia phage Mulch]QAY06499.1 excise [Gordonia phage Parada]QPL13917.1 excise [Gordonia phage NancyRae]QSL99905.1 excise [Gordonia phage Ayotoya]QXO14183.1 excise [Gordonia phage Bock]URP21269.1 excise [Gordonia phage Chop]UXL91317.1 excise [Gordonia phage GrandSlam]